MTVLMKCIIKFKKNNTTTKHAYLFSSNNPAVQRYFDDLAIFALFPIPGKGLAFQNRWLSLK